MDLSPPAPKPPDVKPAEGVIDFGKERELRELRARVTMLTEELTAAKNTLIAPVSATYPYEERTHTIKCGTHPLVYVSMETARVTCQVCGEPLEPMDVLREFARSERQFVSGLNHLRDEAKKLGVEVNKLKKQRSSLRSQVRRKGGTVPDDPNCTRPSAAQYFALVKKFNDVTMELEELKQKVGAK